MTNKHEKGYRLRLILEDLQMTNTEFGRSIDESQGYVSYMVNGHRDLSGSFLEKFAEHYGDRYSLRWLLTGIGEMQEKGSEVREPKASYKPTIADRVMRLEMHWDRVQKEIQRLHKRLDDLQAPPSGGESAESTD